MDMDTPKMNIDLREQPSVVCEACGHDMFREVTYIKKVSKLLTRNKFIIRYLVKDNNDNVRCILSTLSN